MPSDTRDYSEITGITEVARDMAHSIVTVKIKPLHLNRRGFVHGGVYTTIADHVCGITAMADGRDYVTQTIEAHLLRGVKEGTLTAESTLVHRGRSTVLVRFTIRDDDGHTAAEGNVTMFCVGETWSGRQVP